MENEQMINKLKHCAALMISMGAKAIDCSEANVRKNILSIGSETFLELTEIIAAMQQEENKKFNITKDDDKVLEEVLEEVKALAFLHSFVERLVTHYADEIGKEQDPAPSLESSKDSSSLSSSSLSSSSASDMDA